MTHLAWRLARRILLPRGLRTTLGVAVLALPLTILIAGAAALQALTLTGEQIAQRELGSAEVRIDFQRGQDAAAEQAAVAELVPGDAGTRLRVSSPSVPTVGGGTVNYLESDWAASAENGNLRVLDGHLPDQAGETAVGAAVATAYDLRPGDTLALIGGRVHLDVTGVVENPFGHRAMMIYPGAGTADSHLGSAGAREHLALVDQMLVTGLSEDTEQALVDSARAVVDADSLGQAVLSRVFVRTEIVGSDFRTVIEREPALVAVPGLLVPMALAGMVLVSQARRSRRSLALLDAVGMPPRISTRVALLGALTLVTIGTGLGVVVGLALSLVSRPLLVTLGGRDLSPYRFPSGLMAWVVLSVLIGTIALIAVVLRTSAGSSVIERVRAPVLRARPWSRPLQTGATVAAVIVAIAGLVGVGGQFSPALGPIGLGVLAVLGFPALVRRLPAVLGRAGVLVRYSAGVLATGRVAASWAVGCALLLIVAATSTAIAEDSLHALDQAQYVPNVLAGQVIVRELDGPLSAATVERIAVESGVTPIAIQQVGGVDPSWQLDVPYAREIGSPRLQVLDRPDQFGPLLGVEPTPAQVAALNSGQVVSWKGGVGAEGLDVVLLPEASETDPVPAALDTRRIPATATADLGAYAGKDAGAVMLTDTARRVDLPVVRSGWLVPAAPGSETDRLAAVQAVVEADGPAFTVVEGHQPYEPIPSPGRSLLRDVGAWLVFVVAVAMFALLGRSRARDLHTLHSLGVPRRFQLSTAAFSGAVLGIYAVVSGLLIGVVGAALRIALTGAPVAITWTGVLPLAGWVLVAMTLAAVLAAPRHRRYVPTGDQR